MKNKDSSSLPRTICLFDFDGTIKKEPDVIPYFNDTITIILAALDGKFDPDNELSIQAFLKANCEYGDFIEAVQIKHLFKEANLSDAKNKEDIRSRLSHAQEKLKFFPTIESLSKHSLYQKGDGLFRIAKAIEGLLKIDAASKNNPTHKLFVGVVDTMWRNPKLLQTYPYFCEFVRALKDKNVLTGIVTNKPVKKFEDLAQKRQDIMKNFDAVGALGKKDQFGLPTRHKPATDTFHLVMHELQEKYGEIPKDEPFKLYVFGDSFVGDMLSARYFEHELKGLYPNATVKTVFVNGEADLSKEAQHNISTKSHYNTDRIMPTADIVVKSYDDPQLEKEFDLGKSWKHKPEQHDKKSKKASWSEKERIDLTLNISFNVR